MLGEEACRRGLAHLEIASIVGDGNAYKRVIFGKDTWLEPDRISLPLNEGAGSAGVIDLLPQDVAKRYKSGGDIVKNDLSDVVIRKQLKGVKYGKYNELVTKLETNGLVELLDEEPIASNGLLAYPCRRSRGSLLIPGMRMITLLSQMIRGCLILEILLLFFLNWMINCSAQCQTFINSITDCAFGRG